MIDTTDSQYYLVEINKEIASQSLPTFSLSAGFQLADQKSFFNFTL